MPLFHNQSQHCAATGRQRRLRALCPNRLLCCRRPAVPVAAAHSPRPSHHTYPPLSTSFVERMCACGAFVPSLPAMRNERALPSRTHVPWGGRAPVCPPPPSFSSSLALFSKTLPRARPPVLCCNCKSPTQWCVLSGRSSGGSARQLGLVCPARRIASFPASTSPAPHRVRLHAACKPPPGA